MENTRFDYSPIITRKKFTLPSDARVAVWVSVNVEYFDIGKPFAPGPSHVPDIRAYSFRDYGPRVGIWRLMEVLDRHNVIPSVPLNSAVCDHYPLIVEEGKKQGWEFMGHGISNSQTLAGLTEEQERQVIHTSIERLAQALGHSPKGWRSPGLVETFNTPDILAAEGIKYLSDWANDDQPYPLKVKKGELIALPNSMATSDMQVFTHEYKTPEQFFEIIRDQFDTLYEEGAAQPRLLGVSLHPFAIGLPFRIGALDKILRYLKSRDRVWFATGWEIASWYHDHA
ncbi:MAG: polysaccharide deacetylase family protein [Chloroflexi bacterium]|nr:polysaccharide deacetylase family protein [Chloroflexota bacterium]